MESRLTAEEKIKRAQQSIRILNEVSNYEATSDPTYLSEEAKQHIRYCLAFDIPVKTWGNI